jgi:hypothetical protein
MTDRLHDAIADYYAGAEVIAEDLGPLMAKRIRELLIDPRQRDPEMWLGAFEAMGLDQDDADMSIQELMSIEMDARGKDWNSVGSMLFALAAAQADVELTLIPLMESAENDLQPIFDSATRLGMSGMDRMIGPGKAKFDDAKSKRRSRTINQ